MKIDNKKEEVAKLTQEINAMRAESATTEQTNETNSLAPKSYKLDQRNPIEIHTDNMFRAKDELLDFEAKSKHFEEQPHTISFKDIDIVIKRLGVTMPKKTIEVCGLSFLSLSVSLCPSHAVLDPPSLPPCSS
jgi:hypothetical protein